MNLIDTDFGTPFRQAFIKSTQHLEQQRRRALAWLGDRWLLHPDNQVRRIRNPELEARLCNCLDEVQGMTETLADDYFTDQNDPNIPHFLRRQAD